MTRTLPYDVQDSTKPLLLRNTLLYSIKKRYPIVDMATLSKYRREFLVGAQASTGGRSSKVTTDTQQYIAKMVRNGSLDGPRGAQKYLRSINISMSLLRPRDPRVRDIFDEYQSLSGAKKLLNEIGFKAKRKKQDQFCQYSQQKTQWVFSDKTRVNMWGSDSESFYWSDVPGTNQPHQVRPQVQGSGDVVMFWGYISGDGSGYGTAIIDGTIDSNEYVEILKTSLMQTLEYYGKQVNVFVFSKIVFREE
ncbi:hypothetical protein INT46_002663 [Mucor plumbeus]|uniref:Uncharacterized protein n=1 Tax=Mucor plumbeus TaxID=97098 RepID=A0A8H7R9U1_9FUNG|nr:hypothetical protein INT46_002663 [Mucor plumbeus]